jgi:hypothetical protein
MAAKKNTIRAIQPKDFKHYTKLLEIFLYGMGAILFFFLCLLGILGSMPSLKI